MNYIITFVRWLTLRMRAVAALKCMYPRIGIYCLKGEPAKPINHKAKGIASRRTGRVYCHKVVNIAN